MTKIEQLAIEGHGAIQVDESPDVVPLIVFIAGPIKFWWQEGQWDTPQHKQYVIWRTAVETILVKSGFAVYSPYKAIRGRWNAKLQDINNAAILAADYLLNITPPNIPASGTDGEVVYALSNGISIIYAPPGGEIEIKTLLSKI